MKEHKTQILAALALALSLGMMVPNAVFANSGDVSVQAEGGSTGGSTSTLSLADSVATLYGRIMEMSSFANYRNMETLIVNTEAIRSSVLLDDAATWAHETKSAWVGGAMMSIDGQVSGETKTALVGKKVYQVITALKADAAYTTYGGYKSIVDDIDSKYTTLSAQEIAQIKTLVPTLNNVDTMSLDKLVEVAEGLPNYSKNKALYDSMKFLADTIQTSESGVKSVSVDALKALYADESTLLVKYNAMAVAASSIDSASTSGLYAFTLPNTSVGGDTNTNKPTTDDKPEVPETGVLGLIESGALDLSTVVLIGSVTLAVVVGGGLIARLYLKHKF